MKITKWNKRLTGAVACAAALFIVRPEACSALRSFSKEKRSFGEQKNHLLCGWWKLL